MGAVLLGDDANLTVQLTSEVAYSKALPSWPSYKSLDTGGRSFGAR